VRDATAKAGGDVDAAQNFFEGEQKPKAKPKANQSAGKIAALERQVKQLTERLDITKKQNKADLIASKQKAKDMYE